MQKEQVQSLASPKEQNVCHLFTTIYENEPYIGSFKAKIQITKKIKECLILLKLHSISIFLIEKTGSIVFFYEQKFFANFHSFRHIETLEKNDPDIIFLITSDLQYIFFSIIGKEFLITSSGEISESPNMTLIKCISQISLTLEYINGYICLLLADREKRTMKIIHFRFKESKDLEVFPVKNLALSNGKNIVDVVEMGNEINQYKFGVLRYSCHGLLTHFFEAYFDENSDNLIENPTAVFSLENTSSIFYHEFSRSLWVFTNNNIQIFIDGVKKAKGLFEISAGGVAIFNDDIIVSDKITGKIYYLNKNLVDYVDLGKFPLCTDFVRLKNDRIFAVSIYDNNFIFEILNGSELIIHEKKFNLGYILQIEPFKQMYSHNKYIINSLNKMNPLSLIKKGVQFNENFAIYFVDNALKMHLFQKNRLVIFSFTEINIFFEFDKEKIFLLENSVFAEIFKEKIIDTFEYSDYFIIVTRNLGIFIYNSKDNKHIIKHKIPGLIVFANSNKENCFICYLSEDCYNYAYINKFKDLIFLNLKCDKQISSFCVDLFDNILISYWFEFEIDVYDLKQEFTFVDKLKIVNNYPTISGLSINSMIFDLNGHLLIGLNYGKIIIFNVFYQKGTPSFSMERTIDIGDQPCFFKLQGKNMLLAISNTAFFLKFNLITIEQIPIHHPNMVTCEMFEDNKALLLYPNRVEIGSIKNWNKFIITPIIIDRIEGKDVLISYSEENLIIFNEKPAEIIIYSMVTEKICYIYNNFGPSERISSFLYDEKNEIMIISMVNILEAKNSEVKMESKKNEEKKIEKVYDLNKLMIFSILRDKNKNVSSFILLEKENKRLKNFEDINDILFIKKFLKKKYVVATENKIFIIKINKKNGKKNEILKILSINIRNICRIEIIKNTIWVIDFQMMLSLYFYDKKNRKLDLLKHGKFNDYLNYGGVLSEDLFYLTGLKYKNLIIFSKNKGEGKLEIMDLWKMKENITCSILIEDKKEENMIESNKFKWNGVAWGTEYGNLLTFVSIETKFYLILEKIQTMILNEIKGKEIFSYERWNKVKTNVKLIKLILIK